MACECGVSFFAAEELAPRSCGLEREIGTRRAAAPAVATESHRQAVMASSPTRSPRPTSKRRPTRPAPRGAVPRAHAPSLRNADRRDLPHGAVPRAHAPSLRHTHRRHHSSDTVAWQALAERPPSRSAEAPLRRAPHHIHGSAPFDGGTLSVEPPLAPKPPAAGFFRPNDEPLLQACLRPVLSRP